MFKRTLAKIVQEVTKGFPVLLITGPRQVGKTTLFEMCSHESRGYVTLDDMEARLLAQQDPALFLQRFPPPILIDEVQYAPELFSAIKIMVDREKKPGLFWLTGSQKFHLMRGITESLAGRVAILDLLGLSQAEVQGQSERVVPFVPTPDWITKRKSYGIIPQNLQDIYERIWLGSFPKLSGGDAGFRDIFYKSYIQTYIQRDVKDILNITDDMAFFRFLGVIAARTGQMLNFNDIARDVDIDHKTAKSWLSVLETSGLIYLLQPYYSNLTKRLIKTPKVYFLDTGLCSYLTQWTDPKSLEAGAMSGSILETYIFSEILKSYWHTGNTERFYYYRDLDQREIDLVIETSDTLYPLEFKKTATPSLSASKNFPALQKTNKKIGTGTVICFVENDIPLSREVTAMPIAYL